jgi:DNA-binding SARP family transcriptional activator/TolB-like protein/Flp pilus assembly protein TadD
MIHLRTLGALDLRGSEGQELRAVLAQPKRAALLVYLALASPRGPHRRDTLLALFWPEHDAEHARNALSQAVHFLRRSLGAALVAGNGDGVGLDWKDCWCDAVAFEEALAADRLADALDLYRGELLEGFHVADAPEFEEWVEAERARLGSRFAQAVQGMAEQREAAGDFEGAVRLWRQLAARDQYSSRVAVRLMRALVAAGDPAGAVQHARVHETLLREELDVAPDPEVATLVRQLQSAAAGEKNPLRPVRDSGAIPAAATAVERAPPATTSLAPFRQRRRAMVTAGLVALFVGGGGAVALRNGARAPSSPLVRSLAVLPLENLSNDPAQQSFADGMHDALISELARYPDLTVISRTSVVQYKGTKKRLPDIARELKVQGVVEGTILRDGGRVRVNVQLLHGPSDRHLWAKSYERDLRDVLVLQGELAEAIAREVRVVTNPLERSPHITARMDSVPRELQLRELYLKGRHAEQTRSLAGLETAKEAYRLSVERDSTFALGYAGLAGVYGLMATYGFASTRPALDTARTMARRAVALDSTLSETRTALGRTLGDAREFEAAEREFRSAIRLSPSDAQAHYWYAILLVALGRGEEALREIQRAAQLDPFSPRGVTAMDRYARYLITGERVFLKQPAGTRWSSFLRVEPGEPWAHMANAIDLAQSGKCADARPERLRAQELAPDNLSMLRGEAMVRWFCGDKSGARTILEQLKRRPDARDQGIRIAALHSLFGEEDSAFAWIGRTEWTLSTLTDLGANRWLDPLRSDPRYPELLRRLGLR